MARIKIKNQTTIDQMKLMHDGGIKPKDIANVFNIHVSTYQNIKRAGWEFVAYRNMVNNQMKSWILKNQKAQLVKDRTTSTLPPEIDKIVKESNGSSQDTTVGSVGKLIEQISELTKNISKLNSFYGSKK